MDNIKWFNIHVKRVQEEKENEIGELKKIFKEIMPQNFPNLMKNTDL